MITTEEIRALRELTNLSVMECKKALEEASGDKNLALEILKKKGAAARAKKSNRTLGAGTVVSYIHTGGTVGVMLELLCETDFVARNPEFQALARDIAMHIAAMSPANPIELLDQPYIKEPERKVGDLIAGAVQKFGERTEVGQFARFAI